MHAGVVEVALLGVGEGWQVGVNEMAGVSRAYLAHGIVRSTLSGDVEHGLRGLEHVRH